MWNTKVKLIPIVSSILLIAMSLITWIVHSSCYGITSYLHHKESNVRLQKQLEQQTQALQQLLDKKEFFIKYEQTWNTFFKKYNNSSSIWELISKLAVSKNLLNRLQEEGEHYMVIEIDGSLMALVDFVREVENHLPHILLESLVFRASVYGESNLTIRLQFYEI